MTMVTNERNDKIRTNLRKYITIDGESSVEGKIIPVNLEQVGHYLTKERNSILDLIKVMARDKDQANSACNLIKELYYNENWLTQLVASKYIDENHLKETYNDVSDDYIGLSVKVPEDNMKRINEVILSNLKDTSLGIDGGTEGFQEEDMVSLLDKLSTINGITFADVEQKILSTLSTDYESKNVTNIKISDVLPYMRAVKENINNLSKELNKVLTIERK